MGGAVVVPDGLPEPSVVIVAFRREQQELVDGWIAALEPALRARPGAGLYEVPVISRAYRPVRRLIDGGMASAIRVPDILRRTLTHYGDVGAVVRALGLAGTGTVAAAVVLRDGTLLGLVEGPADPAGVAAISGALREEA
jgi:hypothetical protein